MRGQEMVLPSAIAGACRGFCLPGADTDEVDSESLLTEPRRCADMERVRSSWNRSWNVTPIIRLIQGSILTAIAACLAGTAGAAVISLWDFDGNNLPGATTASEGNFTLDSGTFGLGPYQGATGGVLETIGGSAPATIESNLSLGNRRIRRIYRTHVFLPGFSSSRPNAVERGSAFQITFDGLAGDVLEFEWNMLTNELDPGPPADPNDYDPAVYTDFSWFDLSGAATADGTLANVNDGSFGAVGPTAYNFETGQQTAQITLSGTGSYTITVGVNDVADANDTYASALMIDFFRLVRGPEPGTFGTVAGGLMGLSWLSRRRKI